MQRLVQFVFLVVWVIGAVTGGLTVQSPASDRAEEPSHVLMDASHARLSVAREHIVLTVGAPRWSEWWLSVPLPGPFLPCRSEEAPSAPGPDTNTTAHSSIASCFIRPLLSPP